MRTAVAGHQPTACQVEHWHEVPPGGIREASEFLELEPLIIPRRLVDALKSAR